MAEVTVQDGQSLVDIALQVYGSAEGTFILARNNGLAISDPVEPGQILTYDEQKTADRKVVAYYAEHGISPATTISEDDIRGGIGYMGIGIDFRVS